MIASNTKIRNSKLWTASAIGSKTFQNSYQNSYISPFFLLHVHPQGHDLDEWFEFVLVIYFSFYAMVFLIFSAIPFGTEFDMGLFVCTRLTDLIGVGSWFDSFTVHNTARLFLVQKILSTINSDMWYAQLSGVYRSYLTGILTHVEEINFIFFVNRIYWKEISSDFIW
jgi:hypothetical protein